MRKVLTLFAVLVLGAALALAVGCSQEEKAPEKAPAKQEEAAAPAPAEKGKIKIAYVEWSCATASTYVAKAVLEERLGYEVDAIPVSAAAMWQAVASGDADAQVTAWLPTTHEHYYAELKDKVVDLGHLLKGTRIGLVVPSYVTIDSIEQLDSVADKFDHKIIGIDPGAGLMSKTEKVIKDYGLKDWKLMEGSGATMTATLGNAIKNKEWVVVTGWTPHWKFGRWDLKYLADPKGVYGGDEYIDKIVRKGLDTDMPEVYEFFKKFYWTPKEIQTVMAMNQEDGAKPEETAKKWISENKALVDEWLK